MKNKVGVFGMLVLSLFMGCGLMKKQPAIRIDYSVEASSGEMSTRFAEMMMDSISVTLYPAQEIQMMKWKSYLSTYFLVSASDLKYLAIKTENDTTIFFGAEMMDELNKFNFPFYELDKTSRDCHTIGLEAKRRTVAFDSLSNEIEYAADYKNNPGNNEFQNTSLIYHHLFKGISINSGASFTSIEGLENFVGLQYMYQRKTLSIIYMPSYYFSRSQKISNFALLEYKPSFKKNWSVYSRLQLHYNHDLDNGNHFRSYVYSRLGLTYKYFSFGLAYNYDSYGANKNVKNNYGVFLKIDL